MKTVLLAIFARAVSIAEVQAASVPVREHHYDASGRARHFNGSCR